MTSTNDIYSDNFESKLDPYFRSTYETRDRLMGRMNQDTARSALATTRPRRGSRHWGNAPLGMRMARCNENVIKSTEKGANLWT